MNNANRSMITLAREWRGYTQTELGNALSLVQGTISKLESGNALLSDELVEKIAAELRFPREFFFQDLQLSDLPQSLFRRRLTNVSATTLKAARARWAIMLHGVRALLEAVELPECRVPLVDFERDGIGPTEAAQQLRREWNVPIGPIQDVTALVEQMGVLVVPFDFGSERIDGMSIYNRALGLPPMIFVNKTTPGDRQRFTTLHELCHLVAHSHLVGESDRDLEHEADVFASEFLLPSDQIRGHLSAGVTINSLLSLKVHWKASMQSLLMKAFSIDAIDAPRRLALWKQVSKRGWRTLEPNPIPREEPTLLYNLLRMHEQQLGYSAQELGALLCQVSVNDLWELYPAPKATKLRLA